MDTIFNISNTNYYLRNPEAVNYIKENVSNIYKYNK